MNDPIAVPVGPCRCPGTPHGDGDIVYLRPVLGLTGGLAVEAAMTSDNQTLAVSLALIHHNIVDWTFEDDGRDERNRPAKVKVPISVESIETWLPYAKGGEKVANQAATLYLEDALAPLGDRVAAQGKNKPILAGHKPPRPKKSASSSPAALDGEPSPIDR